IAEDATVELYRNGTKLQRMDSLNRITTPGQYAYSGRSRRVYVSQDSTSGSYEFHFKPILNLEAGAYLNLSAASASRALNPEKTAPRHVPIKLTDPPPTART